MAVAVKTTKKVRELSPELKAIQLPVGKKAKLVVGRIVIVNVVVKVAPKADRKEVMQYTMRGQTYEMPENGKLISDRDEVRRLEWLSVNARDEQLRHKANEMLADYHTNQQRQGEALSVDRWQIERSTKTILRLYIENGCKQNAALRERVQKALPHERYISELFIIALILAGRDICFANIAKPQLDEKAFSSFVREGKTCDWFGQVKRA